MRNAELALKRAEAVSKLAEIPGKILEPTLYIYVWYWTYTALLSIKISGANAAVVQARITTAVETYIGDIFLNFVQSGAMSEGERDKLVRKMAGNVTDNYLPHGGKVQEAEDWIQATNRYLRWNIDFTDMSLSDWHWLQINGWITPNPMLWDRKGHEDDETWYPGRDFYHDDKGCWVKTKRFLDDDAEFGKVEPVWGISRRDAAFHATMAVLTLKALLSRVHVSP